MICLYLDAFQQPLPPFCLALGHVHDPSYFHQPPIPLAPCSKEALEEDVCVVYHVGEGVLHVLV